MPLSPLLLALATLLAADEPFLRAIQAVADGRVVEMTKALAEVRAAETAPADRAPLEEDCAALARLAPDEAAELLRRVRETDVAPPVPPSIRALLVHALARRARARDEAADPNAVRRDAGAAVELAARSGDGALTTWARGQRVEALLAAVPRPDDGVVLEEDLAALRASTPDGAPAARERLDRWEAFFAHRQGDDARAHRLLAPIDAAASDAPLELLELRLVVATRLGRFDDAERDAAWLAPIVASTEDRTARARARLALATWHRLRPAAPGEAPDAPYRRAVELYARAAEDAEGPAARAAAVEWRGAVRSHLREHDEAREDFELAAALYRKAGRDLPAARQQMRRAWDAFLAGDPSESRRALERFDDALAAVSLHATGRLGEQRNADLLRARVALADDDLDAATAAMARVFAADRRLTEPLGRRDILLSGESRGAIWGSLTADLLAFAERVPAGRGRAYELAVACSEHARVLLLAKLLGGPERPTFGLEPGSLPPLPPGVAEVRWARTAETPSEEARYVLLARHGDAREMQALETVTALDRDVDAFLGRWMAPTSLGDGAAAYAAAAHDLFLRMFGPAARWFVSDDPPRRLVVVADGLLERLPVDAFVTAPSPDGASFGRLPYLLRTTAVVGAPSLGVLAAIAPPNDHAAAVAVLDPIVRGRDGRPLPSLRSTHLEREALLAARDVTVLRRETATLPRLRRALRERETGWLHVAGHSVEDPVYHDRAALLLTTNPQSKETLGVMQVVRLPLTEGTRVVLSGCSTASGVALPGEGVQALWRAFLVARASCVLSTLRPVDDRSAAHWMSEFHAAAAGGMPLAEAARRASLRWVDGTSRPEFPRGHAARDAAHPYLWAAWTCVGHDGGPLPLPAP